MPSATNSTTPTHHTPIASRYKGEDASALMGKGLDSQKNPPPTTMHDAPLETPTNTNIKSIATSDPLPLSLTLIDTAGRTFATAPFRPI